jgi:cadmium resistance protein CadD (predicted permease)
VIALAVLTSWALAYIAALAWVLQRKSRLIFGGLALGAMSVVPTIYGRWTTRSDWHDYPMMGLYYLPTFLAASLSVLIVAVGLFLLMRRALARRGAK